MKKKIFACLEIAKVSLSHLPALYSTNHLRKNTGETDHKLVSYFLNDENRRCTAYKSVMKELAVRLSKKPLFSYVQQIAFDFNPHIQSILEKTINILNSQSFNLHRNALRCLQSICLVYVSYINENIQETLECLVGCSRGSAPLETSELSLDVTAQFCRKVETEKCFLALIPMIPGICRKSRSSRVGQMERERGERAGKEAFAALSILDRLMVRMRKYALEKCAGNLAKVLISVCFLFAFAFRL